MNPRITFAVATRVLTQIRRDHRTAGDAARAAVPADDAAVVDVRRTSPVQLFDQLGPGLLALFPFIIMFLVTSVTTLRERSSGTLERLLAMPMGKLDFLLGYAIAFGVVAAVQSALAVALSVGLLGLDVAGPGLAADRRGDRRRRARLGARPVRQRLRDARSSRRCSSCRLFVVPQILLCGLFIAREQLPPVLEAISNVLPLSYATDAMKTLVRHQRDG